MTKIEDLKELQHRRDAAALLAKSLEHIAAGRAKAKEQLSEHEGLARAESMFALKELCDFAVANGIHDSLLTPVLDLFTELQDADRGAKPGPILKPIKTSGRPPGSTAAWSRRAAAAGAMELLHRVEGKPTDQAAAEAGRMFKLPPKSISEWRDTFSAENYNRMPDTAAIAIWQCALHFAAQIDPNSSTKSAAVKNACHVLLSEAARTSG